jgi:hypothetical protein
MSRLISGRGVIAANRSRNSSGSKTKSLVPLDRDLEAEAQRLVCLQVVAGPCSHRRRLTLSLGWTVSESKRLCQDPTPNFKHFSTRPASHSRLWFPAQRDVTSRELASAGSV